MSKFLKEAEGYIKINHIFLLNAEIGFRLEVRNPIFLLKNTRRAKI